MKETENQDGISHIFKNEFKFTAQEHRIIKGCIRNDGLSLIEKRVYDEMARHAMNNTRESQYIKGMLEAFKKIRNYELNSQEYLANNNSGQNLIEE